MNVLFNQVFRLSDAGDCPAKVIIKVKTQRAHKADCVAKAENHNCLYRRRRAEHRFFAGICSAHHHPLPLRFCHWMIQLYASLMNLSILNSKNDLLSNDELTEAGAEIAKIPPKRFRMRESKQLDVHESSDSALTPPDGYCACGTAKDSCRFPFWIAG